MQVQQQYDPSKYSDDEARKLLAKLQEEEQDRINDPLKYFDWDAIPVQKSFIYDPTPEKWAFCGKGTGKTAMLSVNGIVHATGEYPDDFPQEGRVRQPCTIRFVTNSIERVLQPELEKWMPKKYFKKGDFSSSYNQRTHICRLTNGSKFIPMTWDQELIAFKGENCDIVILDEHGDKGKYEECKARLRGRGFTQLIGALTPDEVQKGREELWELDEIWDQQWDRDDLNIHRGYTGDNPFNPPNYVERLTQNRTEDEKRVLLWGDMLDLCGLLFRIDKQAHIRKGLQMYKDFCVWEVIDPHPSQKTAIGWFAMLSSQEAVMFHELHVDATVKDLCSMIKDVRHQYGKDFGGLRVIKTIMDESQVNSTNIVTKTKLSDEFRKYGIIVHPSIRDMDTGIMKIREWLGINKLLGRSRLTFCNNCPLTIHSMSRMSREIKKNERIKHWFDLVRYFVMDEPYYFPYKRSSRNDRGSGSPLFWNVG